MTFSYNKDLDNVLTNIIKVIVSPILFFLPKYAESKKSMQQLSEEPPIVVVDFNFMVRKAIGTLTKDEKKIVYNADVSVRNIQGRLTPEEQMKLVVDAVGLKYHSGKLNA